MPKQDIINSKPTTLFQYDMTKEGWTLVKDAFEAAPLSVDDFEPVSFLKEGEQSIKEEVMLQRAKNLNANLGQRQAEYLLECREKIPAEQRQHNFVFPGTVWRVQSGFLCVPCLFLIGGQWHLFFSRLERDWCSRSRLLRPR